MENRPKTGIHGFSHWVDFSKALVALTIGIGTILGVAGALAVERLDQRYAPVAIVEDVRINSVISVRALRSIMVGDMRETQRRLCDPSTSGHYREDLVDEKTRLMEDFHDLFNDNIPIPSCGDLGIN